MFKFLKSKKGFTLVELMIVVVIMAILVAVAVPIYSAVTKNARTKTCIANMREIVSQINNFCMSKQYSPASTSTVEFKITSTDGKGSLAAVSGKTDATITEAAVKGLFQQVPGCPAAGEYVITIGAASGSEEAGGVNVSIVCNGNTDAKTTNEHVYGATVGSLVTTSAG